MRTIDRLALRAYPPSFRLRYGNELAALVEDTGPSARTTIDLAIGAARAWVRPTFSGPDASRWRLQASVATTWTAWCAGFLVAPAVNRALLDPPTRGTTAGVHTLLDIAFVSFFVGWALAVVGAAPVVLRFVVPAVRRRQWTPVRPLLPTVVLALVEAIGLLAIGVSRAGSETHPGWVVRAGVGLWLVGFAIFSCFLGLGPAATLTRLRPSTATLRVPLAISLLLALALTLATGCSLAAAAAAGDATLMGSTIPVWFAISVAAVASVIALTSSVRGVSALPTRQR